jgi:hypothetical protein
VRQLIVIKGLLRNAQTRRCIDCGYKSSHYCDSDCAFYNEYTTGANETFAQCKTTCIGIIVDEEKVEVKP